MKKGFTILEFMFAILIGSMLVISLFSISVQSSKTLYKSAINTWSQQNANQVLAKISRQVREAKDIRVFDSYNTTLATTNEPGKYLWIEGISITTGVYLANNKIYYVPDITSDIIPSSDDDYILASNVINTNIFSFDDFNLSVKFKLYSPQDQAEIILEIETLINPRNI